MTTWRTTRIPFEDRGPLALLTLETLENVQSSYTLDQLDRMELVGLVREEDDGEPELEALAWVGPAKGGTEGVLALVWSKPEYRDDPEARDAMTGALDELAIEKGYAELVAYTRLPYKQIKQWSHRYGFEVTRLREVRRVVSPPKEPGDG